MRLALPFLVATVSISIVGCRTPGPENGRKALDASYTRDEPVVSANESCASCEPEAEDAYRWWVANTEGEGSTAHFWVEGRRSGLFIHRASGERTLAGYSLVDGNLYAIAFDAPVAGQASVTITNTANPRETSIGVVKVMMSSDVSKEASSSAQGAPDAGWTFAVNAGIAGGVYTRARSAAGTQLIPLWSWSDNATTDVTAERKSNLGTCTLEAGVTYEIAYTWLDSTRIAATVTDKGDPTNVCTTEAKVVVVGPRPAGNLGSG